MGTTLARGALKPTETARGQLFCPGEVRGCILALVTEHPDWTLEEILAAMHKQGIPGSRTALWRFLERHDLTFKKKAYVQPSAIEKT